MKPYLTVPSSLPPWRTLTSGHWGHVNQSRRASSGIPAHLGAPLPVSQVTEASQPVALCLGEASDHCSDHRKAPENQTHHPHTLAKTGTSSSVIPYFSLTVWGLFFCHEWFRRANML